MTGFYLLLGHLLGDYIVQTDFLAQNKTNSHPGPNPDPDGRWLESRWDTPGLSLDEQIDLTAARAWQDKYRAWKLGNWTCTIHCFLYTLAIWGCSFWWMPWWGLVVCFVAHWPTDRFRLAFWWMTKVSGQRSFAQGILAPWSIILVDNTFHLLTLGVIAAIAGAT